MNLIKLNHINKKYQTKDTEIEALKDITFTVCKGDFIAIVGPSGCGKSTILSILSNLEDLSNGNIINYKENIKYGYMFQQDTLFDWITIMDNCLLGPKINRNLDQDTIKYCEKLLKTYGLYEFKDRYPHELSGGMRQRVALIRTLMTKPDILLLDEPFSALDYQNRLLISNDVYNIIKKENKTTIMVTHDVGEAVSMADKIIVLSKRPSVVKSIYKIEYKNKLNPINNRLSDEYNIYCNKIWRELDVK
ncbi:MAG: ABC transporter ATP-binding protein [Bacilli bacterium]